MEKKSGQCHWQCSVFTILTLQKRSQVHVKWGIKVFYHIVGGKLSVSDQYCVYIYIYIYTY